MANRVSAYVDLNIHGNGDDAVKAIQSVYNTVSILQRELNEVSKSQFVDEKQLNNVKAGFQELVGIVNNINVANVHDQMDAIFNIVNKLSSTISGINVANTLNKNVFDFDGAIGHINYLLDDTTNKIKKVIDYTEHGIISKNAIDPQIFQDITNIKDKIGTVLSGARTDATVNSINEITDGLYTMQKRLNSVLNPKEATESEIQKILDAVNNSVRDLYPSSQELAESIERVANGAGSLTNEFTNIENKTPELDSDLAVLKEAFGTGGDIIKELASKLGISTGKIGEFTNVIGKLSPEGKAATIGLAAIVGVINILSKEADQAIDTFKDFASNTLRKLPDTFSDIATGGIDLVVESLSNMKNMIDSVIEKITELSEAGSELNTALFVMGNYMGDSADNLAEYIETLGGIKGINVNDTTRSLKGLFGSLSNMNLDAKGMEAYSEAFIGFMNDLSAYQDTPIKDIAGQIEAALSFGVLNSRSALAKALDITDSLIEEFKSLGSVEERAQWILARWPIFAGKYDEWMQTDQGKVQMLKNTWENLMGTVGQLALKVYATVAPLLTQILNLVNSVLGGIYKLFNVDADGSSVGSAANAYNNLANSFKNVGNAAKEAERKTASFDNVIQISDSSSSGDVSDALAGAADLATIMNEIGASLEHDETLWEKWANKINNDISVGKWRQAGKDFGQFIYEWLDQIDWGAIYDNINKYAINLSDFFNGLNSNKSAWLKAGETIGKGLNAITLAIRQFFMNFDGKEFGDSLGFMWKNMWDTFDEQQAADALYEVFNDVFEIVAGFLNHGGFMSMAESITKVITSFFSDIAENGKASEYAQTLYDLVKNILLSLANAVYTVVTDENTKKVIKEGISTLLQNLADDSGNLATDMITLVTSILDFISETLVSPENVNKVVQFIKDFVDTIVQNKDKIVESIKPIISAITDGLKQLAESGTINELGDTIIEILDESGMWDLIGQWMILQMQHKLEVWKAETIAKLGTVLYGIGDSLEFAWKNSIANILIQLASQLPSQIAEKFKDIWPAIKSALETIWNNFKSWWNNHFGGKNLIDIAIPDWIPAVGGKTWNFKIPALATGGIAKKATLGVFGEDGAEAILPLEKNTGWMDTMLDKLVNKMNTNNVSSNQQITIDMSKCTKEYYTKSEMIAMGELFGKCLKQAGMNVAVV